MTSSRPWPTAEQIETNQGDPMTGRGFDRRWSMFDLSECSHGLRSCVVVDDGWAFDVCVSCGDVRPMGCTHPESEWNAEGTLLRCKTCGMDGT